MKKNVLMMFAILIAAANYGFGQEIPESDVPSLVLNEFKKEYPNATDIEWKQVEDLFKVEFDKNKKYELEVWYDETGNPVKYEEEIPQNQLPEKVLSKVNGEFKDYKVKEVEMITENNSVIYEIEFRSKSEKIEVTFNPEGEILKRSNN